MDTNKNAFTLIELLVVIAVIGLLISIAMPVLSIARERAKVVAVNSELRQAGLALEMYIADHKGKPPATRKDCALMWADHQLPPELAEGGYLTPAEHGSTMSAALEDRYNPGCTYKYASVGELYQNGAFSRYVKASLYVPAGFPEEEGLPETDILYDSLTTSPVTWVLYSEGPKFDEWEVLKERNGPVARRGWYDSKKRRGIITRLRLKGRDYEHIGSFE